MNILFAASEAYPFIKTGGLGDVVHSLPIALSNLGHDVRLVLPAYRDVIRKVDKIVELGYWDVPGVGVTHRVRVLKAHQDELGDFIYLLDVPTLFDRPGNPYVHIDGYNWPDNAERFTVFSRAVALLACGVPGSDWLPEIVHCHDWQTGLVPAFLSLSQPRPKTVFTIHNLAYDGFFSHEDFIALGLPPEWWSIDHVEFYGGLSMLKAGMVFSDHITTVSQNYAREICTATFGYRFEGILQDQSYKLTGILNGIDLDIWNPRTDPYIEQQYSINYRRISGKKACKANLLETMGFENYEVPLLGFIGRLVEQKGIDMVISVLPELFETTNVQFVVLGSGHGAFEAELEELQKKYPRRLHVHIGYSESLAHKIEAGCDMFIMPSRFEPCGLNQMYSLRYGTLPVVHHTGGLADTVIDATQDNINLNIANGFVFYNANDESLLEVIHRALSTYSHPKTWKQLCINAMKQELGWLLSAQKYIELYQVK